MNMLRSRLARAVLAGIFELEEAEAVSELIEFYKANSRELPQHLKQALTMLLSANDGFNQTRPAAQPPTHCRYCAVAFSAPGGCDLCASIKKKAGTFNWPPPTLSKI